MRLCAITIQSENSPIIEAFFDVISKDNRFDSFSPQSVQRMGYFRPDGVIPWRPEEEIPVGKFSKKPPSRHVPKGFTNSKEEASLIYVRDEPTTVMSSNVELMWCCPGPEMGPVVVTVNVRLREAPHWQQLSFSLKESAIRCAYICFFLCLIFQLFAL